MSPNDQLAPPKPNKPQVSERAIQRRRLLEAQTFAQDITLRSQKVQKRYREGMESGSLHPAIERALLDLAWGKPGQIDQRFLEALGTAGAGLINFVLRKALTDDPLSAAKPVAASVIDQSPALPKLTAGQIESVVPPSRPARKPKSTAPPLRPGEEVLP